jgi:photosystem II stability/assembly factor-like uncharacterized protein
MIFCGRGFYITTNGGNNWRSKFFTSPEIGSRIENAYFFDTLRGVIFSTGPKEYYMFQTSNSGTNWTRTYYSAGSTPKYPNFIFSDANTGIMAASSDVKRTTNGGMNWSNVFASGINFSRGVFKYSSEIYFSVGHSNNYRSISKTTNGGLNWTAQGFSNTPAYHSIFFINANTGLVCGEGGLAQYTTNQGSSWVNIALPTLKNLNKIFFLDETTGFIAGDSGRVFMTTNGGGLTGVKIQNQIYSGSEYILYNSYCSPKPCADAYSPLIKFSIPQSEIVRIKIYDIMGREQLEVVNENFQRGTYEVRYNISSLPSGIYFYRMEAGNFSDTKQMTFIK